MIAVNTKQITDSVHSLDHGLASKSVPGSHVEDASLVNGQVADEAEAVDCLVAVDWHCVDKGGEAQAIAQSEGDDACAGQQCLCCHIHNGNLQRTQALSVRELSKGSPISRQATLSDTVERNVDNAPTACRNKEASDNKAS